ncbi:MAG: prolipoprotein diacylglyceryl transferase [Chloroflexi bacterium]|nr:MAG: prolipoprotein diacylglyceryl transferase [Phototrophicales bacterium]RMF82442.1 MAG: prolipoprotein diacylglyceryl transferase [Chloroflexota bacterium]
MEFQRELVVLFDTLQVRYYGVIIVVAMLIAATVATNLVKRDGRDPDHVWGTLTWAIIPGIIGARLWFVLFPPISLVDAGITRSWFFNNITDLDQGPLAVWSGGLSIFGAVIGGMIGGYIYMRRNKLDLAPWLDVAGVALPLAQAIGRFANFVNQELYGTPTTLPWGIPIDQAHRVGIYRNTVKYPVAGPTATKFHPLFAYEALWNIIAFFVLLRIYRNHRDKLRPGDVFLLYVAQYSFIRFLLEFIRVETSIAGGVNTSQAITGLAFFLAVGMLWLRIQTDPRRQKSSNEATDTEDEEDESPETQTA